jgi:hypothetical protein
MPMQDLGTITKHSTFYIKLQAMESKTSHNKNVKSTYASPYCVKFHLVNWIK